MPLEYGQTPWDDMSREDLLLEVKRLYSATVSLHGSLHMCSSMSRGDSYFTDPKSRGYRALHKGDQALALARRTYTDEEVARCYFRYADDLLFSGIGEGWMIDSAGRMMTVGLARVHQFDGAQAEQAGAFGMTGTLRRLAWDDLKEKT